MASSLRATFVKDIRAMVESFCNRFRCFSDQELKLSYAFRVSSCMQTKHKEDRRPIPDMSRNNQTPSRGQLTCERSRYRFPLQLCNSCARG